MLPKFENVMFVPPEKFINKLEKQNNNMFSFELRIRYFIKEL